MIIHLHVQTAFLEALNMGVNLFDVAVADFIQVDSHFPLSMSVNSVNPFIRSVSSEGLSHEKPLHPFRCDADDAVLLKFWRVLQHVGDKDYKDRFESYPQAMQNCFYISGPACFQRFKMVQGRFKSCSVVGWRESVADLSVESY